MTARRTKLSRRLRSAPTDAEALLWRHLRARQISGYKFRRQHAVGPYVLDFFCHEAGLAIEVDGSQHMENGERDEARTRYLGTLGIRVVRYTNIEVLTETDSVLEAIFSQLRSAPSP
jgi:very-short-patch-repair endonuclease